MKMMKMKALAVAVLGLAAGNAMAVCPTISAASPGAWSSAVATQGALNVVGGNPGDGLNNTACKMQISLNQNSALFAKASVTDTTPIDETRYRARFYFDTSEISGLTSVLRSVKIFNASATTSPANLSGEEVAIFLNGATGAPTVTFQIADSTQGSGFRQIPVALPVAAGVNRIEFDITLQNANATFKYWLTAGNITTSDGSPTATVTGINNSGWSGITQASLGMFAANNGWRTNYAVTNHLYFDEFDSRRTSFIGQ